MATTNKKRERVTGEASLAVYQRMAEGWDPSCAECERARRPCGAHPRDLRTAVDIQRQELEKAGAPVRAPATSRARADDGLPKWARPEAEAADNYEARSILCGKLQARGAWNGLLTTIALAELWGVDRPAIGNYRRAGSVACAASRGDIGEMLEETLGAYREKERLCDDIAAQLEAKGRHQDAARYREMAKRARDSFATVAGLMQHRMTISLEADPRIAGLYAAQLAALEDFDRMAEQQRLDVQRVLQALLSEVERLNGGVLPAGLPELPPALPSAKDHVRDAVKRYEAEIGARKLAA